MVKEFTVFLENVPGILAQFIRLLDSNEIRIHAISVTETDDYGLVSILVNKPKECEDVLGENDYDFKVSDVVVVNLANKRSLLYDIAEMMGVNGININYLYSTLVMEQAHLIINTNNTEKTINVLKEKEFSILEDL